MSRQVELESALIATGSALTELRSIDRWRVEQAWREIYAAALHTRTGRWRIHDHEWEVFAGDDTPSVAGAKASALFIAETPGSFYVWPEEASLPIWLCTGGSHRALSSLDTDVHVFPPDFSWTMAFTHEQSAGLGPYFSRREWQPGDP